MRRCTRREAVQKFQILKFQNSNLLSDKVLDIVDEVSSSNEEVDEEEH